MITSTVTAWLPGVDPVVIHDSTDNRTDALRAAGIAAHTAITTFPESGDLAYLAIVIDNQLLVTLGIQLATPNQLHAALTELSARLGHDAA